MRLGFQPYLEVYDGEHAPSISCDDEWTPLTN